MSYFLASSFLISSVRSRSSSFISLCFPPQTTHNLSSFPIALTLRKPHYTILPSSIHAISSPDVLPPYRLNAINCRSPRHRDPVPRAVEPDQRVPQRLGLRVAAYERQDVHG